MIRPTRDELRAAYTTVADSYDDLIPNTRFEAPIDLAMVRHFLQLEKNAQGFLVATRT